MHITAFRTPALKTTLNMTKANIFEHRSPPKGVDTFERSSYEPTEERPKLAAIAAPPSDSFLLRTGKAFGYALALGAGLVGACLPGVAGAAVETTSLQSTAVGKALQQTQARRLLENLPSNFSQMAKGLSNGQARVLKNGMSGHTQVGPVKINNRQAFIRGHVLGKKVWPEVNQQIRDARSKYKMINQGEEQELLQIVSMASQMSPQQRETMAKLMDFVKL